MRIAIGSDHRGVQLKARLLQTFSSQGHEFLDAGADSDQAVDYPDIASTVSQRVLSNEAERGILICGTGIGMAITANKFPGIRAAVCQDELTAETCRRHNDANVLCLPGDLPVERAARIVEIWLATAFEGGRHARRLDKIAQIEQAHPGGPRENIAQTKE